MAQQTFEFERDIQGKNEHSGYTMTPKDKARELANKFCVWAMQGEYLYTAKQCALIAVDEIIKDKKMFNQISVEYWEDVKQEIEKL